MQKGDIGRLRMMGQGNVQHVGCGGAGVHPEL